MANREIPKIAINSERILEEMKSRGVSFITLHKILGISDWAIGKYVKDGKAPPHVVKQLSDALGIAPHAIIAGKTIWMRLGVTVPVTDQEMDEIIHEGYYNDVYIDEVDAMNYLRRAVADGESYIPQECIFSDEKEV